MLVVYDTMTVKLAMRQEKSNRGMGW